MALNTIQSKIGQTLHASKRSQAGIGHGKMRSIVNPLCPSHWECLQASTGVSDMVYRAFKEAETQQERSRQALHDLLAEKLLLRGGERPSAKKENEVWAGQECCVRPEQSKCISLSVTSRLACAFGSQRRLPD